MEASRFAAASYFEMGGYLLTGDGFAVPEPTSVTILAIGAFGLLVRR